MTPDSGRDLVSLAASLGGADRPMKKSGAPSVRLVGLTFETNPTEHALRCMMEAQGVTVRSESEWDQVRGVVKQTAMLLRTLPRPAPWIGYLTVDHDTQELVGFCGFKDGPVNGVVEIAYFTLPRLEGRGHATAAASALVEIARSSSLVSKIIARTLREMNASTRVLRKCGFVHVGEVNDPEDGVVWQWERSASDPTKP